MISTLLFTLPALAPVAAPAAPQDDPRLTELERRLAALEAANARLSEELEVALDGIASADAGLEPVGEDPTGDPARRAAWARLARRTLSPRASNVYDADGLSFGGYGEFLGQVIEGSDKDNVDALRWVLYFGNRLSDRWIFNSEIELEHGTTDASSATSDSSGSVSVEFAYLDHLLTDDVVLRGGTVLVPLGFVNERHEPTTFLPSARPVTETRIIPSTWRANGLGGYGQVGDVAWTAYVLNGLDGQDFDASGLRGGRQKANRASIENIAFAGKADYVGAPGVTLGGALFHGDSGVGGPEDLTTTIFDLHAEWNEGPWSVRALWANALVDDTAAFNTRTGENLAERLTGWYVEAGFDLLSLADTAPGQSLDVFVRYEDVDTQADLADGFTATGGVDDTFTTVGLNYRPLDQVVLKADHTFLDEGDDVTRFLIGYAF